VAQQGGISGTAVASVAAGGLLLYSALLGKSPLEALKQDIFGLHPSGIPKASVSDVAAAQTGPVGAGGYVGLSSDKAAALVQVARQQIGKPYYWGAAGPDRFDCSGLVSYCLRQIGVFGPSQRMVTGQFLLWSGATTVPRPPRAGDLICWTGHIAIAVSSTRMVAAPGIGRKVLEQNIYWTGSPQVRRIKYRIGAE
jgi:cell wall-associated NlpC family hydrolase